jgi:hypothetical protein
MNGLKKWHFYTMKIYSVVKKNKILSFLGKWVELENIILSEVARFRKCKAYVFSHMWNIVSINYKQYCIYIYTNKYRTSIQKQDWLRRLREEDKKDRKLMKIMKYITSV